MLTRAKMSPIPQLMVTGGKEYENPEKEVRGFLHCWQLATSSKDGRDHVHRIVRCSNTNEPIDELVVHVSVRVGVVQCGQRTLVEASVQYGTAQNIDDSWQEQRWVDTERRVFRNTVPRWHVSTTTCHGNDLDDVTTRQGLCNVEASLRLPLRHQEAAVIEPDSDSRSLVGVLGHLRADRPDLWCLVKKPMSEGDVWNTGSSTT